LFEKFYKQKYSEELPWWDQMDFFNGWYLLIIVSDCLTITGTILKVKTDVEVCGAAANSWLRFLHMQFVAFFYSLF